jgi:hypothetical protein
VTRAPTPETVEVDFITPRHLAGGGDPAWITVPLHRACGWSHRLEPDPDDQWWTLQHVAEPDRPAWYASFGARTPVELIAAFTDALTDPAPAADAPCDPYGALRQAGWSPYGDNGLASPDKTAYVERLGTPTDPEAWFITVTLGMRQKVWQARFGAHTPPHLVTAFTAALGDPKPVHRTDSGRSLPTLDPISAGRPTCSPCTSPAR